MKVERWWLERNLIRLVEEHIEFQESNLMGKQFYLYQEMKEIIEIS